MKIALRIAAPLLFLCALAVYSPAALAQGRTPLVSVDPIDTLVIARGGKAQLDIALQVNRGFHVNSHHPSDELLLPTVVHLDPPEGIVIMNVVYPEGEELALPFAGKDRLSVYSGIFEVTAEVRIPRSAALGTQRVHGAVRYQACDNRQCFPPKTTPLEFDVRVVRPRRIRRHVFNPDSPHIR
jgi:Thiol:disulfide interchange protein DsbD, N-terminal